MGFFFVYCFLVQNVQWKQQFYYPVQENCYIIRLLRSDGLLPSWEQAVEKVMPDDHSKLVPPLPIPNRTVKQLCADDSAATSVKVGYCQACYIKKPR